MLADKCAESETIAREILRGRADDDDACRVHARLFCPVDCQRRCERCRVRIGLSWKDAEGVYFVRDEEEVVFLAESALQKVYLLIKRVSREGGGIYSRIQSSPRGHSTFQQGCRADIETPL